MNSLLPTLTLSEWTSVTPDETNVLRHCILNQKDRSLLAEIHKNTSLRIDELSQGLKISVGPHVGTVTLSQLHLIITPKLRLDTLLGMVAYAFEISHGLLTPGQSSDFNAEHGLTDLLGFALLKAVQRLNRYGLIPRYQEQCKELRSPRGRILMVPHTLQKNRSTLSCRFHTLTSDHLLNQTLATGLRLAATLVQHPKLRRDLMGAAHRILPGNTLESLNRTTLAAACNTLDRHSSHYRSTLSLIAAFVQSSYLNPLGMGETPITAFLLDMNRLFEGFVTRHLQEQAPADMLVRSQDVRHGVFTFLDNPNGWSHPTLRPDLVFLQHGQPLAIGDVKYRDHQKKPPSTQELYQLVSYGLAYPLPEPRDVFLFYPLPSGSVSQAARLRFAPQELAQPIYIQLVVVPIDRIVSGEPWWPMINLTEKRWANDVRR
jgi:5-methylcytosine-specific restriction endonuclease McrBC regulatory subunit McrC